ncbi:MAG: XrtA/PEP-CTERM system-associated ATPase [Gammaproteobacteria bacterium]
MYEAFYKLTGKPFQLSPDPEFLYLGRGHKRALAYLRYGLEKAEGFIIITGNVGTGKTTLAHALLKQFIKEDIVAGRVVTTQLDPDDTLRMVAGAFGLRQEGKTKATLLQQLEQFFVRVYKGGKRTLLLVDEAQNMPRQSLEELRMLSNLTLGEHPLFQCFLLAQNEFQATLNGPGMEQFRQRVIAGYHLTPLDLSETRSYIEYRLRHVGWDQDPVITDDGFEAIYRHSHGVPRQINRLADRILVFGFLDERHEIDGHVVDLVAEEIAAEVGAVIKEGARDGGKAESDGEKPQGVIDSRLAQIEAKLEALTEALKADR